MGTDVNWLAVVVGTVGYQILGFVWYGQLFSSIWMNEMGYSEYQDMDDKSSMIGYAVTTIGSLIAVIALAIVISWVGAATWQMGLIVGVLIGVGFVATTAIQAVPFEGRPWRIYAINAGYNVVALAGIGIILALW